MKDRLQNSNKSPSLPTPLPGGFAKSPGIKSLSVFAGLWQEPGKHTKPNITRLIILAKQNSANLTQYNLKQRQRDARQIHIWQVPIF